MGCSGLLADALPAARRRPAGRLAHRRALRVRLPVRSSGCSHCMPTAFRCPSTACSVSCPLPFMDLPTAFRCPSTAFHCPSTACPLPFVALPLPPNTCPPPPIAAGRSRRATPPQGQDAAIPLLSFCMCTATSLSLRCLSPPPPLPSCNPFTLPIPHRCRWRPSWASACMSARCRFCTAFHTAARSVNGPHTSPPPCCLTALPRCFTAFQCPLKRLRMLNRVGSTCTSPPCPSRRCSSTWTTIRQHRPITQPCPSGCPDEHHAFSLRVFVEIQRTHREIVGVSRPRHTT